MAIKKIKLPGMTQPIDIGVVWTNISDKPDLMTSSEINAAINTALATNDAMIFKGTIGSNGTITQLPATHNAGWTYKVISNGSLAGEACEIGDMIVCIKDGTVATADDWTVIQTNIDGIITGPSSSTINHIATFAGTTGKTIKDSGFTIGTSVPANAKFTDTTYSNATQTTPGLMSTEDKIKLDGIANNANNYTYTLPTASTTALGGIKTNYTTTGKNYPVVVDNSGNAYVNVPWTNVNNNYLTSHQTVVNDNISVTWNTETTIATIGGTPIKIKIPAAPASGAGTVTSITLKTTAPLSGGSNTAITTSGSYTIGFSNQNVNTVLAGPSSGSSAAAPSFRKLVAADIPALAASKITSGVFDAARIPALSYLSTDLKGANNGVAELDNNGLVPISQLPNIQAIEWNTW